VSAAIVFLLLILGCMSLSIGGSLPDHSDSADGVLMQKGDVHLQHGETQVVYYPIPYASPPNLTLDEDGPFGPEYAILEQAPDHFRVGPRQGMGGRLSAFGDTVRWKAQGVRAPAPVAATPPPVPPPPAPISLKVDTGP
jgi:hypothetical protein